MGKEKKALLVENEPIWQDILSATIGSIDFDVDISSTYIDAFYQFVSSDYDLIVIDLGLGANNSDNKNGLNLVVDACKKGTPSVVVSGLVTPDDVKFMKPYDVLGVFQKTNFTEREQEFTALIKKITSDSVLKRLTPSEEEELRKKLINLSS